MRVRSILFSQNPPQNFEKSPYADLTKKYNVKVHFFKFFQSEEIETEEFRKKRVNVADYTAIIMTSKKVIDHFFSLTQKMKISISPEMHFYCINEAVAFYLQKYIVYRKRKIFYGNGESADLVRLMEENAEEKYLFPCAMDSSANDLSALMDEHGIVHKRIEIYRIAYSNLKELDLKSFDMIVFFSPHGVESLKMNYPDFDQGEMLIGALGTQVLDKAQEEGLRVDVQASAPGNPSIFTAIDQLLQKTNGRRR